MLWTSSFFKNVRIQLKAIKNFPIGNEEKENFVVLWTNTEIEIRKS